MLPADADKSIVRSMHDSSSRADNTKGPCDPDRPAPPSLDSIWTSTAEAFCARCLRVTRLATIVQCANEFNTDVQDIVYLLETGVIHSIERREAAIAVCRASLVECFETRRTRLLDSYFEIAVERSMSGGEGR